MAVDREALQVRLLGLFLDEVTENVGVLNRGLVALEQQAADLDAETVVNEVFRAAHSLKGGAHSAGVPALASLCHHLEDALSRLREGSLAPTPRVIQPLLAAVDALDAAGRRLRDGAAAGGDDLTQAGRALVALVGATAAAEPVAANPSPPPVDEPVVAQRRDGSVRVPAERLEALLNSAGELLHACRGVDDLAEALVQAAQGAARSADASLRAGASPDHGSWRVMAEQLDRLARAAIDANLVLRSLGRGVAASVQHARMMPLTSAYDGLDRVVRDLARAAGKDVRLELHGGRVEVDRPILDAVADAVLHLVRNAVDHAIEAPAVRAAAHKPALGTISVEATLVQDGVAITVTDDGRGLDLEALRATARRRGLVVPEDDGAVAELAFLPGLSTAPIITEVSGRGVGLDAVRARIEAVGGSVALESSEPCGCTATLRLPLALSAVRVLLVEVGGEIVALPSSGVTRLFELPAADVKPLGQRDAVVLDDGPVPALWLSDVLGLSAGRGQQSSTLAAVLVGAAPNEAVLVVDELISEDEVVMKPLGEDAAVPGVLGATILANGRVALVLNPITCVRNGLALAAPSSVRAPATDTSRRARVLLAEDTITTRALERSILESAGYEVLVAVDGLDAWQLLEEHGADAIVSDVDMPRMSGIAFCQATRRSSRFADVPFILVTSLASDADRRRGVDAGASAYLVKADFDQALLLDTLEQLL